MYRILDLNPQLEPFAGDIDLRMHLYRSTKKRILSEGQSLNDFANAHCTLVSITWTADGTTGSGRPAPTSCIWRANSTAGTRPPTR